MARQQPKKKGDMKLYRNTGVTDLHIEKQIFEPGSEFRAELEPHYENQMLMGGHLEIVEDQSAEADRRQADAADAAAAGVSTEESAPSSGNKKRSNR